MDNIIIRNRKEEFKELVLYTVFGNMTFVISIGSYAIFNVIFGINELIANALAWILIAPVLDILIYAEPVSKVFAQGFWAFKEELGINPMGICTCVNATNRAVPIPVATTSLIPNLNFMTNSSFVFLHSYYVKNSRYCQSPIHIFYPNATSNTIITEKPTAKNMVPISECSPSDISGISSSTTT